MKKIKKKRNILKELRQKKLFTIGNNPAGSKLLYKIKNNPDYNPDELIVNDPTRKKVSGIIIAYASPFIVGLENEKLSRMIDVVIIVWNISLLPKEKRDRHITELVNDLVEENNQLFNEGKQLINAMIKRKDDFFSEYNNMIQEYELTIVDGNPYLAVVSEEI
jgi:hypothetical protein